MPDGRYASSFLRELHQAAMDLGGICNAHLHIDRSGTLHSRYLTEGNTDPLASSHTTLAAKHGLIPLLHNGKAYEKEDLAARVNSCLDEMVAVGTSQAVTFVDVTCDRVGLSALQTLLEIGQQRRSDIRFRVGAYSPLGFRDDEPERWELLVRGAKLADFIGSLPERDDRRRYPEHIGFKENCRRIIRLGQELGKPVHVHVDQRHDPAETGAEWFLDAADEAGLKPLATGATPAWLIHLISPTTYPEPQFDRLVARLVNYGIGIVCCPSAAISMLQLRPQLTPTDNSIARILDLLAAGIKVRIGSDNIADFCSPAGTPDLMEEMFVLANALRFYHIGILAKLAAGLALDGMDIEFVQDHLKNNRSQIERLMRVCPGDAG